MVRTQEEREMTPVDVIVNNAGGVVQTATHDLTEIAARWQQDFRTNVLTAVLLTEALLPHLRRPNGRIIHLSSIAAAQAGEGSYSAPRLPSLKSSGRRESPSMPLPRDISRTPSFLDKV